MRLRVRRIGMSSGKSLVFLIFMILPLVFTQSGEAQVPRVFAAQWMVDGSVSEVDITGGTETTIASGFAAWPGDLVYVEAEDALYVITNSAGLYKIFVSSGATQLLTSVPYGNYAGLEMGPDGNLYSAETYYDNIHIYSTDGDDLGEFVSVFQPQGLHFDGDGNLYVTTWVDQCVLKFGPDGTLLMSSYTIPQPIGVTTGPDGRIWVLNYSNEIIELDANGFFLGSHAPGLSDCYDIEMDATGRYLYIADMGGSTLNIFDTTDYEVVSWVRVNSVIGLWTGAVWGGCPDMDGDGYDAEACGGDDCDDTDPDVNPGAHEVCNNGIDDDCDGLVDGADPDCILEYSLDLVASYGAGRLSLDFTIGADGPVVWSNYLILTSPTPLLVPLWSIALPALDPPFSIPISFAFPSFGVVWVFSHLSSGGIPQAYALEWVDTGS